LTGFGTVLLPAKTTFPPDPVFEFQGLAGVQTMQLIVSALSAHSLQLLDFVNESGSPVGPSLQVNLQPGQAAALNLNADSLGLKLRQRTEIQPTVAIPPSTTSVPTNFPCQASAEVFDRLTGRTWTQRTGTRPSPTVR
jgi:hypothetical protein